MSTEEQREDISGKLSATSTWLEDEGFGATTAVRGLPGHGGQDGERKESWSEVIEKDAGCRLQPLCPLPPPRLSDVEGEAGRATVAVPRVAFSSGRAQEVARTAVCPG